MIRKLGFVVVIVALAVVADSAQSGARIKILTEQEVVDLMTGVATQGTRSSDTAQMIRQAKAILSQGRPFKIVSVDDLPDDWNVVSAAGGIGGGGAWEYVTDRVKQQNLPTVPNGTVAAIEALSKRHFGFDVDYKPIEDVVKMRPKFGH